MIHDANGNIWFKGNLHTHTTISDGRMDPQAVLELYQQNGYDFIALTDHYRFHEESVEASGLLCLSGAEYDTGRDVWEGIYHITAIGCTEEPALSNTGEKPAPQTIIDEIHRCGGLAVLAHPAWSMNTVEGIRALRDLDALEIYNTVSGIPWNARPYSGDLVDRLALYDAFIPCIATDDAHFYTGDACRSFILVKAAACTREALFEAIRRGDFYATQGPEFSVCVEDGEIIVRCSPVRDVIFTSNLVYAADRVTRDAHVTEAHYRIKPGEHFVRVELVDANGLRAWSSAIPVFNR